VRRSSAQGDSLPLAPAQPQPYSRICFHLTITAGLKQNSRIKFITLRQGFIAEPESEDSRLKNFGICDKAQTRAI